MMKFLVFLLISTVLSSAVMIPILRSFEYEGDDECVAFAAKLLHILFAMAVGFSVFILIGVML